MKRTLLIKPASSICNMKCTYCFYADEVSHRTTANYGIMTRDTAHAIIDKALKWSCDITFMFQGGEPTCAGIGYFDDFVSYCKKKASGNTIHFALQTNGYCIDRKWAQFFCENNFLIGLSLDGNKKTHDIYRVYTDGSGTFKRAFRASQYFASEHVEFNILVTVTEAVAKNIKEIYAFFKRNHFRYQQYIACIEPFIATKDSQQSFLPVDVYGKFLVDLFELYFADWKRGDFFSIRYFDDLVLMIAGFHTLSCGMSGFCPNNYVLEADGSVYPCDFYILDKYRIGNLVNDSFEEIDKRRSEIKFTEKSLVQDEECKKCRYYGICKGGCRRNREDYRTGTMKRTSLCSALKYFFDREIDKLLFMGKAESRARAKMIQ